jgi:hypothetical protein
MAARQRDREYKQAAPRADAYTGMLVVSLVATLAGLIFAFLDYNQYQGDLPKLKSMMAPAPMGGPVQPLNPQGGAPNPGP